MRILAIGAHPDDIEIGCAGTLLTLQSDCDAELYTLVLSCGRGQRENEQKEASRILSTKEASLIYLTDTRIELSETIRQIEGEVNRIQPDLVFTHYGQDTHQDHRTVAAATVSVCRNRGNIFHYESLSSEGFEPTLFVDISDQLEKKCEVVKAHTTQEMRLGLSGYVRTTAKFRAFRMDADFVEGFVPRKFLWTSL